MEKTEIATLLTKFVRDANPTRLRGGHLSALLKAHIPDFDAKKLGCKNLREFVRSNAPDVVEEGRAGTDIIYAMRQQQQPLFEAAPQVQKTEPISGSAPLRQLLSNPHIWKTFASPNSAFRLFVLPDGKIRVLRPVESPQAGWGEIQHISAESLLQIAKEFVSDLPESHRSILRSTLSETKWWIPFFIALDGVGLKSRWIDYRRRRIAEEFERSFLAAQALPVEHDDAVVGTNQREIQQTAKTTEPVIQQIALRVIQRMTEAELRALNLPLGYVMDALTS